MIFTDAEVQALQMSRSIFGYIEGIYIQEQVVDVILTSDILIVPQFTLHV